MISRRLVHLLIAVSLIAVDARLVVAQGAQPSTAADSTFLAKLAPFKTSGDTSVDITALRRAFAATSYYAPYDYDRPDQLKRMWTRINEGDVAAAGEIADSLLATNFFDIGAQVGASVAAAARGDSAGAASHAAAARAIVRSIESTGDGHSPEHPLFVLAVDEEYAYLALHRMKRSGMQSLTTCGGHKCDRLEVEGSDGKRTNLYFDVSLPSEWMTKQFEHADNEKPEKP